MLQYPIIFIRKLIEPKSAQEDIRRREFILNILLLFLISFLTIATVMDLINFLDFDDVNYQNNSLGTLAIFSVWAFFVFLYVLSRRGFVRYATYGLVGFLFILAAYLGLRWGVDLPAEIVFYPIVIVIAGILIDTRFAFIMTGVIVVVMSITGFLDFTGVFDPNDYWRGEAWAATDIIMISLIYLGIATVSWLSNREIERSLVRARKSERELKEERDLLEVRVEQRTEDLRKAQLEQITQTYRFVEFGRLAGGIFHDLTNPLTALSLNIESIAASHQNDPDGLGQLSGEVKRAQQATLHMQKLLESMRKHIAHEGSRERFSLDEAIDSVIHILAAYARSHQVELHVATERIRSHGDPVAFTQILTNFISNAIESFPPSLESGERSVDITMTKVKAAAQVCIKDTGPGIPLELQEKIFEPFFSTKSAKGLGIGLSLAKGMLGKEFDGSLSMESAPGAGTTFTLYFPIREP